MTYNNTIPLTRKDICTLKPSTWLNDNVVNCYLLLIQQRTSTQLALPRVHIFNTFFYPRIIKNGHSGVERWTRKIDIFSFDLILVPIHLETHWCMAVIDFRRKEIVYFDSLKRNNSQCIIELKKYLNEESKSKGNVKYDFNIWAESAPKGIPGQMNDCDCGVFACKYADYYSRDAPFVFTQADIPNFRNRMVFEIITKQLL